MDPRRPELRCRPPRAAEPVAAQHAEMLQFLALAASFLAASLRQRLFFWLAVLCALSSWFGRPRRPDRAQQAMVLGTLATAFASAYLLPSRGSAR